MRILLIDADSKIANLCLMKLSAYHKSIGDMVELIKLDGKKFEYTNTHDKAYASIIFSNNKNNISGNVEIGGVGHDLNIVLPNEVEHLMPDYSIYPEFDWSLGYLTRGCIRNCSFCVVPKKEGKIKFNAELQEFYNSAKSKIMLLDNNFLAYKGWEKLIFDLMETKKKVQFKQGLDFRILSENQANTLSKLSYYNEYIFAFDNPNDLLLFERKFWMIQKYFNPWKTKFYVLVGYNTSIKEDIVRVMFLIKNKSYPFIMRYEKCYDSPYKNFYTDLAAWCNQPGYVKILSFAEFVEKRYSTSNYKESPNRKRISESIALWESNQ